MGTLMLHPLIKFAGLSSFLNEFAILVQHFKMFITVCTSYEKLAQELDDFKGISFEFIAFLSNILELLFLVGCLYQS